MVGLVPTIHRAARYCLQILDAAPTTATEAASVSSSHPAQMPRLSIPIPIPGSSAYRHSCLG